MKRACIAIVDATRARLYRFETVHDDTARELREASDLVHPGRRAHEASDRRGHVPIAAYDAAFARDIVVEIDRIVRAGDFQHVILVASPKMLGELRKVDDMLHAPGMIVDEIPRDLAKLTSPQLHDHLAELKLLPPRQRLGARSAVR